MNLENTDFNEVSKNISNEWIKNIAQKLGSLQSYVSYMNEGADNLEEFIVNYSNHINFDLVKHKNYRLFLSDSYILLAISKKMIEPKKYIFLKFKLDFLKLIEKNKCGWLDEVMVDAINKRTNIYLKNGFEIVEQECFKIFSEFVEVLWKYLTPQTQNEEEFKE